MCNHAKEVNVTIRFDLCKPRHMHHHTRRKQIAKRMIERHRTLNTASRKRKNRRTAKKNKTKTCDRHRYNDIMARIHNKCSSDFYIGSTQVYVVVERWQAQKEPREL